MWNYRVIKRKHPVGFTMFTINEVHYDSLGKVKTINKNAYPVAADTLEELKEMMLGAMDALEKPLVEEE